MEKVCFIVSSIGEENSPERARADEKYDLVYEPVLTEMGYTAKRADKESTPNSISRDIISRIIRSELVIADVSDSNPNVFYELAVRNAVKRPVIVIKNPSQKLPFDIADKRAIVLDMNNNRQWVDAKKKLMEYIKNAERDPIKASESIVSDFTFSIDQEKAPDPQKDISLQLKDIKDAVQRLNRTPSVEARADSAITNYPWLECKTEKPEYKDGDTVRLVINALETRSYDFTTEIIVFTPDHLVFDNKKAVFLSGTYGLKTPIGVVGKDWKKGRWNVLVSTPDKQATPCTFIIN